MTVQSRAYIETTLAAATAGDIEAMVQLRCIVASIAIKAPPEAICDLLTYICVREREAEAVEEALARTGVVTQPEAQPL